MRVCLPNPVNLEILWSDPACVREEGRNNISAIGTVRCLANGLAHFYRPSLATTTPSPFCPPPKEESKRTHPR